MVSVYFYVPNLIGYTRILLDIAAFYVIYTDFKLFFVFYAISAWLDIADGHAARALDQCSRFGAVLDMVTDRASTSCLIVVLAQFYPKFSLVFCFLIALDIMSHFARVISSLSLGNTSHKAVSQNQSWLIRLYYTNRFVLGFMCFGNEAFFLHLYLLQFYQGPLVSLGPLAPYLSHIFGGNEISAVAAMTFFLYFPIMFVKQYINLIQLKQSFQDIADLDEKERVAKNSTASANDPKKKK